ncbi:MAG TPA: aminoglycoside phosphotransferase family protein [Ktedonobacterales bacterium]|nr:aminoglycoside phosphotransferase family protein [Ktedonobacterales bacterium]
MDSDPRPGDVPAALDLRAPLAVGRTAEVFAWGDDRVLKLFRPGWRMDVARHELAVARAIYDVGVPSPHPDEVIEVAGRAGVVYERIHGPSLLALLARPGRWGANARTLGETHAAIHAAPAPELPPLDEALRRAITAAPGLPAAERAAALGALDALVGSTVAAALCHVDYHPANVLLDPRGPKVIDWENATIGDPAADVARTLLLVRSSEASIPSRAGRLVRRTLGALLIALYLRAYGRKRPLDRARLAAWELPITAARLNEGIAEERGYLLARVRRLAARG